MSVERSGSKTDAIVKLVLVFFVALLSFSIGTFVGKKFSDNQHKMAQMEPGSEEAGEHKEAATHDEAVKEGEHGESATHGEATHEDTAANEHDTKDEHGDRNVASVSAEAHNVKPEKALTDEEISKLAEEFVVDDKKEASKGHDKEPAAHEEKNVAVEKSHETKEPAKHEEKHEAKHESKSEEHAPSIPSSASRIPSALPKEVAATSSLGKYTVQVASYPSEHEAQKRAAELKEKGFSAFYISVKIKNQTWYRVNVGLFTTQKEADAYKKDLISKAQVSSPMVQKLSNIE